MKFSEKWLREWVDPGLGTEALADRLTAAGLEVESVEPVAGALKDVVVGEITAVSPHPSADRLTQCEVEAGRGEAMMVVCGAPNVYAGMRAPMALPGARLPDGTKIRRSRIRGVESDGMLCSAHELGLGEDADGILALDALAPVGTPLADYLGLDDVSIDLGLTPNRGDCLGLAGIAREVAALSGSSVEPVAAGPVPPTLEDTLPISLDAPAQCPRYVGRIIRDIDPSARTPLWICERLRRSGVRPISPVVDVTNYVMLELGQPLHAFDLATLDRGIRVRLARTGELITLLDGTDLNLDRSDLVIADESRAVALAGVMGGLDTGVNEGTRDVLLESAWFDPITIARTARARGLHTDASHRFERGVDFDGQRRACERASALLLEIVGGQVGPIIEAAEASALPVRPPIGLRASRIQRLLGVKISPRRVVSTLERLGMVVEAAGKGEWQVTPPTFRLDITMEADLIEELARIVGYDTIPEHVPVSSLAMAPNAESRVDALPMKRLLVQRGYQEAITYSFVDPQLQRVLDPGHTAIELANPISADMAVMRTTLWPGLVQAVLHNAKRQQSRVRLFEVGTVFRGNGNAPVQESALGGVVTGPVNREQWGETMAPADFFDVKGDIESVLGLGGDARGFRFVARAHPALHPGQAAGIDRDGRTVGLVGALHPRLLRAWKLDVPVYVFQLATAIIEAGQLPRFRALSKFPTVRRDIAVVVAEAIAAEQVRECVGQAGIDVLKKLELFDVYRGEGIDPGRKSLALGLTFEDPSRTLNDDEVDAYVRRVVDSLADQLGGKLRG